MSDVATSSAGFSLTGTRGSHRWREMPGNWDKLNCRAIYPSDNEWGIPALARARWTPARLVAYSARSQTGTAGPETAVHFFLDDYRFETIWTQPERSLTRVAKVGGSLTPDFSLWREMPLAMQLWQVYRSRWCGAWMAEHGIQVIPTVSWSTAESFSFAFAGIAHGSVVAVSAVGVRDRDMALFGAGMAELARRVEPPLVLCYGRLPPPERVSGLSLQRYETRWD